MVAMKPKTKKALIISSIIVLSLLALVGVFWGTYYFFVGKSFTAYEKDMKGYIKNITDINSETGTLIKDQTIDTEKTKVELPKKVAALLAVKDKLSGMPPTEKYSKEYDSLMAGLNSNIYIYKQMVVILNNPQANDIEKASDELNRYVADCKVNYSKAVFGKITISLPEKTNTFITQAVGYINAAIGVKKQTDVEKSINSDFISKVDNIVSQFSAIKIDLAPEAATARVSGSSGFDKALSRIDSSQKTLDTLITDFSNVVPRKETQTIHSALEKTLNDYSSYLQSFRYALSVEKVQTASGSKNQEEIDKLYADANLKLINVQEDFETFSKLYSTFRDKSNK